MNKLLAFTIFSMLLLDLACNKQQNDPTAIALDSKNVHSLSPSDKQSLMIKRGEYLVRFGGCNDCHTPKVFTEQGPMLDESRLLAGHPAEEALADYDPAIVKDWALFNHQSTPAIGPWRISFAANLSSDETGIGNWSIEQFKIALCEGKYKGMKNGRPLLPPMPVENFAQLADEDLEAIFAYLKSTKPIPNIDQDYNLDLQLITPFSNLVFIKENES